MWKIESDDAVSLELGDGCKLYINKENDKINIKVYEVIKKRILFVKSYGCRELGVKVL